MKATKRVTVARRSDFAPGDCRYAEAAGVGIALCRVRDRFYAVDNCCPHAGGPLAEGVLDGEVLTCPWHAWRYDVRTGARLENPDITVPVYPIEVVGEDVIVQIPDESA